MIRSYQGRLPQIPASCYVDLSAQVIGDVTLGEHSSVWMNAVLRGDVNSHPRRLELQRPGLRRPPRPAQSVPGDRGRLGHHRPQRHRPRLRGRGCGADRHGRHRPERLAASAKAPLSPPEPWFRSAPLSRLAHCGPASPPSSAANSRTRTANSFSSTQRIIWTTPRFS